MKHFLNWFYWKPNFPFSILGRGVHIQLSIPAYSLRIVNNHSSFIPFICYDKYLWMPWWFTWLYYTFFQETLNFSFNKTCIWFTVLARLCCYWSAIRKRLLNSKGGSTFIVDNLQIDKDGLFPPKLIVKFACWHRMSCPVILSVH